jgi:hypothetical protein
MVVLNPFAATIDLETEGGKKLWKQATTGITPKISLTKKDADRIRFLLAEAATKFNWAAAVTKLPIEWDDEGNNTITVSRNVLDEHSKISVEEATTAGGFRFGSSFDAETPEGKHDFTVSDNVQPEMEQIRVKSCMIAEFLMNSFTDEAKRSILVHRKRFEYTTADGSIVNDGVAMLLICLKTTNPNTKVGISNLKSYLSKASPDQHNGDIAIMINAMEQRKQEIEEKGGRHDDFLLNVFDACEKSKNKGFTKFAATLRDKWESDESEGEDFDLQTILQQLTTKWNNISQRSSSSDDSTDPPDAKFIALTTEISTLKTEIQNMQRSNGSSGATNSGGRNPIAPWRYEKTLGASVTKDGKTWYWCTQHAGGKGMYVTHHPDDHGKPFHERRGQRDRETPRTSNTSGGGATSSSNGRLQLNDRMQAALTSRGFTADQTESIIKEVSADGVDFW